MMHVSAQHASYDLLELPCYMHAVQRLCFQVSGQQQDWAADCCTYAFHDVGREAGVLHSLFAGSAPTATLA